MPKLPFHAQSYLGRERPPVGLEPPVDPSALPYLELRSGAQFCHYHGRLSVEPEALADPSISLVLLRLRSILVCLVCLVREKPLVELERPVDRLAHPTTLLPSSVQLSPDPEEPLLDLERP